MKIYNSLSGIPRDFANSNELPTAEFCDRANRPRHKTKDSVSKVAGDGNHGFRTRRRASDPVKMTEGTQGQYVKDRKTTVRSPRRFGLRTVHVSTKCTNGEVKLGEMRADKILWREMQNQNRRLKRKKNRNRKAARGQKCKRS